jgi:hypothetical protein
MRRSAMLSPLLAIPERVRRQKVEDVDENEDDWD